MRSNTNRSGGSKPFFQLYPESTNTKCVLTVYVYSAKPTTALIEGAEITVYSGLGGRHTVIYKGQTDSHGRTIPIELPLNTPAGTDKSMFCICVRHDSYMPENHWITVKQEKQMRKYIELEERRRKSPKL